MFGAQLFVAQGFSVVFGGDCGGVVALVFASIVFAAIVLSAIVLMQ